PCGSAPPGSVHHPPRRGGRWRAEPRRGGRESAAAEVKIAARQRRVEGEGRAGVVRLALSLLPCRSPAVGCGLRILLVIHAPAPLFFWSDAGRGGRRRGFRSSAPRGLPVPRTAPTPR